MLFLGWSNYENWKKENLELHILEAKNLLELRSFDAAIESLNKILEINPQAETAWHLKGYALFKMKRFDEAIKCFNKALEINPHYERAWHLKGCTLGMLSRFEEAIECCNKALDLDPQLETWMLKGVTLSKLERLDNAIECYNRALEINPQLELAWYFKARAADNLGLVKIAVEAYRKFIDLPPKQFTNQISFAQKRVDQLSEQT